MSKSTGHYGKLMRGIAQRRRVFLFLPDTRTLIYPARGTLWEPSVHEEGMCDAFVMFVVSELEEYFEGIIGDGIEAYSRLYLSHVLRKCSASKDFVESISRKKVELSRNNNANWSRISHFFEFLGLRKEVHFPPDFWDDIESIVKHRGDLAHNGTSIQIVEDRRNIIAKIETTLERVRLFDQALKAWLVILDEELLRSMQNSLDFSPTFPT